MREKIHNMRCRFTIFEEWFDRHFGWFFTNGMKDRSPDRSIPEDPVTELRTFQSPTI